MEKQTFSTLEEVWGAIIADCRQYGEHRRKQEAAKQKIKDIESLKEERDSAQDKVSELETELEDAEQGARRTQRRVRADRKCGR